MGKSAGSWKTMTERAPYTRPYQRPWGLRSFMSPIQEYWEQQPVAGSPALGYQLTLPVPPALAQPWLLFHFKSNFQQRYLLPEW